MAEHRGSELTASTPSAAAFSRSGITRTSGRPSVQALVEVDEAAARLQGGHEIVAEVGQLLELEVAAQLDLELALVRRHRRSPTCRRAGRARPGSRPSTWRPSSMISCTSRRLHALQHHEHDPARRVGAAFGAREADAGEHAGDFGLREHPFLVAFHASPACLPARCPAASRSRRRSGRRPRAGRTRRRGFAAGRSPAKNAATAIEIVMARCASVQSRTRR